EKAEKMAKTLIAATLRQREKDTKKKQKKASSSRGRGRGHGGQPELLAEAEDEAEAEDGAAAAQLLQQAERDQSKVDALLVEHMSKFELPKHVPLTRVSSTEEKQSRSA
ncbi:unnamed protein product, partial [Effrenium voratum]